MKPLSAFTTPRKLICPISRHFLPVEHPEPLVCCTTGLKKGSRFPFIAHFFSSGFGGLGAATLLISPAGFSSAAILVVATTTGFASGTAIGLESAIFATTGVTAAGFLG